MPVSESGERWEWEKSRSKKIAWAVNRMEPRTGDAGGAGDSEALTRREGRRKIEVGVPEDAHLGS